MAAETFDEYMARDGHRYDYAPQAAEMAWEAAIASIEGVQNQTNNMKSGGVTRNKMTMYANSLVPDNEIWVSKKTYDQCAVERAAQKIKDRNHERNNTEH